MTNQKDIDLPSVSGRFGWERIGSDDLAIPVIVRSNGIRYAPVRIVEQEIIKKYGELPQSIFHHITITSYCLTPAEAKLLNNVNFNHCNERYGSDFFSSKDLIISVYDTKELSRFLNISLEVFTKNLSGLSNKLGLIRFYIDPHDPSCAELLVPYICRVYKDSNGEPVRFVPGKFVEPYVSISSITVKGDPTNWDLMYLKMLSIYSQNASALSYITREGSVIRLDGLMYSRTNTPIAYADYKT